MRDAGDGRVALRVSWFQLITDLERHGLTLRSISLDAGISLAAVYKYKAGSEPGYHIGQSLIDIYIHQLGREPPTVPTTSEYATRVTTAVDVFRTTLSSTST